MLALMLMLFGYALVVLGLVMFFKAKRGEQCTLGGIIAIIGLIIAVCPAAFGHDHLRPANNDYLKSLHSKGNVWCCDGNDTDAIEDWDTKDDRYRVKYRGQWFDVPKDAVVDDAKKGIEALLWMNKGYGGPSVRCFKPGSMT